MRPLEADIRGAIQAEDSPASALRLALGELKVYQLGWGTGIAGRIDADLL